MVETLAFTYAKIEASHYNDSLAVDPTNPDVGSSGHPGGLNLAMPDGSVRFLHASDAAGDYAIGAPPADGYLNPSSFQIVAAGPKGEAEPQFTTEPTAPQAGGGHKDWIIVESCQFADAGADGKGYVLTSIQHSATEESQLGDPVTFTFTVSNPPSQTSFSGFLGGINVASGDVNGATMDRIENLGVALKAESGPVKHVDWIEIQGWDFEAETRAPDTLSDYDLPAVMDASFRGGTTVEAEPVLEGHQCLVFFLG